MPQVFSTGWLYLFLFVMVVCAIRIATKVREIHREQDKDTPVVKVKPVLKESPRLDDGRGGDRRLAEPDHLIRKGHYRDAVDLLTSMLPSLSPPEDREMMGKMLYRIGACQRRIGSQEGEPASLLRSGEALREAVSLFSPVRLRPLLLRALSELGGLYEDLAAYQNPVENLNQALKTWSTAISTARELGLAHQEAVLHFRSGYTLMQLASHVDRRQNLEKALEVYEAAVLLPDAFNEQESLFTKGMILKTLGDLRVELSALTDKPGNMDRAVLAYEDALQFMPLDKHPAERGVTLLDMGQLLLDIYDAEHSPADLRKALRCLKEGVDIVKSGGDRTRKGFAMALLGDAMVRYAHVKDPEENLDTAIRLYETALGFLKEPEYTPHRDRIREGLRVAVEKKERI
jgi:tetratricopeptide (TPR) repeat protein